MDRSTRSLKHKLFDLVPEITKLERSNRKALRKNLFGDEMSSGGNNNPGGNTNTGGGNTGGNSAGNKNGNGAKKHSPSKPKPPPNFPEFRRKRYPDDIAKILNERLFKAESELRKELDAALEEIGRAHV